MPFIPKYEVRFDGMSPGANVYCLTAEEAEAAVRQRYPNAIIGEFEKVAIDPSREVAQFVAWVDDAPYSGEIHHWF